MNGKINKYVTSSLFTKPRPDLAPGGYEIARVGDFWHAQASTFTCLHEITVPRLFTTLVRPHLEYGNIIWSPRFKMDSTGIEKVQRRATKLIPSLRNLCHEDRLRKLKLPSLWHRRRRGDMIQVYKITRGIDRIDPQLFFCRPEKSSTRSHSQKLTKQHSRTDRSAQYIFQPKDPGRLELTPRRDSLKQDTK